MNVPQIIIKKEKEKRKTWKQLNERHARRNTEDSGTLANRRKEKKFPKIHEKKKKAKRQRVGRLSESPHIIFGKRCRFFGYPFSFSHLLPVSRKCFWAKLESGFWVCSGLYGRISFLSFFLIYISIRKKIDTFQTFRVRDVR